MQNGTSEPALIFRRMTSADRREAFALLAEFLVNDEYYRDSSAAYGDAQSGAEATEAALGEALALFVERPDYGFVWLVFEGERAVACSVVSYAISTSLGKVVAKLDDVFIAEHERGRGIGRALLQALAAELRAADIGRIDVAVHRSNETAKAFYRAVGFQPLHEERYALVL